MLDRIVRELGAIEDSINGVADAVNTISLPEPNNYTQDFAKLREALETGFGRVTEDAVILNNVLHTSFETIKTELEEMRASHERLMEQLIDVLRAKPD